MEDENRPSYYAVIPANVRYDKRLSSTAKLFYGEITCLATKEGYCWASNTYFAELYDISDSTVTRTIRLLENCGYIKTELYKKNQKQTQRRIYINECPVSRPPSKNDKSSGVPPSKNDRSSPSKNDEYNNTSTNNINLSVSNETEEKTKTSPCVKIEKHYFDNFSKLNFEGKVATEKPIYDFATGRKFLTNKLKIMPEEMLITILDKAMTDDFCLNGGYELKTILSVSVANRLYNQKTSIKKAGSSFCSSEVQQARMSMSEINKTKDTYLDDDVPF